MSGCRNAPAIGSVRRRIEHERSPSTAPTPRVDRPRRLEDLVARPYRLRSPGVSPSAASLGALVPTASVRSAPSVSISLCSPARRACARRPPARAPVHRHLSGRQRCVANRCLGIAIDVGDGQAGRASVGRRRTLRDDARHRPTTALAEGSVDTAAVASSCSSPRARSRRVAVSPSRQPPLDARHPPRRVAQAVEDDGAVGGMRAARRRPRLSANSVVATRRPERRVQARGRSALRIAVVRKLAARHGLADRDHVRVDTWAASPRAAAELAAALNAARSCRRALRPYRWARCGRRCSACRGSCPRSTFLLLGHFV